MLSYLIIGLTLGSAAGISPGPLLALLVSQTLRHGLREGLKVALAPVLTDAPIVAFMLLLFSRLPNMDEVLGYISVCGGFYVIWLGIESLRTRSVETPAGGEGANSIRKAMAINLLNPHVYVFWGSVGAPTVLRATESGTWAAAGFVAGFYVTLCGAKMILAMLVNRSRSLLQGAGYRHTLQALGVVLLGFGVWLIREGWLYLSR